MRIENVITQYQALQDGWVRINQIRRIPRGLEICLALHASRRGRRVEAWKIGCLGVREFWISDVDGGGLALYSSMHPAARQYTARKVRLRWSGCEDVVAMVGSIAKAHWDAVDDWIPFDYLTARAIERKEFVCQGPDFLMHAYAKALRALGARIRLVPLKQKPPATRPRVLHTGSSAIVADRFLVEALN